MLSPKLKQQVASLWDLFWTSGMTNPLTAIEQITYLIFLKRLEALDLQRKADGKPSVYGPRPQCELEHHPQDGTLIGWIPDANSAGDGVCQGHNTCRWSYL